MQCRRIIRHAMASMIIVVLGSASLNSQGLSPAAGIRVDDAGTCPPDNQLRQFPTVTQPAVGVGSSVVKFGVSPWYQGGEEGSESISESPTFNQQVIVYGYNFDQTKVFVRLKPSKDFPVSLSPRCGWISVQKILIPRDKIFQRRNKQPQPLQMRDISESEKERRNFLDVKAVVHDLSLTGEVRGIDVYWDPEEQATAITKIQLFDTYLVYDQLQVPAKRPGDETRYWLIGKQSEDGRTDLAGWVRQRDVVIWPSRLAVQWNEDATVSAYATPENLSRGSNPIAPPQRIERVDFSDQITRRLPVLDQAPPPELVVDKVPVGEPLEVRRATAIDAVQYYKIASPGKACRRDNPADCWSARDTDKAREKLVTMQKAALRLDILILIDATESMEPYFLSTVAAIRHFVEKAAAAEPTKLELDIRFGISLYGDYRSEQASVDNIDYREIVPFFRPSPNTLGASGSLSILTQEPKSLIFRDVHKDKLEAPFAAIIRASERSKWRPKSEVPLRFVVHIADDGNRDRGRTSAETAWAHFPDEVRGAPQSTIREVYGEEDVVKALEKSGVIYVPVAVLGGTQQQAKTVPTWNRLFQQQANRILSKMKASPIRQVEVTYSEESIETLEDRVGKTVVALMSVLLAATDVADILESQTCAPDSKTPRCLELAQKHRDSGPGIIQLVDRVASETAGLSAKEMMNIYSRDQSIVTLYAPAKSKDGRETFTHWVVLEERDFKALRRLLTSICEVMGSQDAKNPVVKATRQFLEMYGHEDFEDLTISEIMGKRLGIPNLERTDFSSRTRDEIDDAYRAWQTGAQRETWEDWHRRVCKAMMFTELMEDEKKVNPDKITCDLKTNKCSVPDRERRNFKWKVQVSLHSPVYYVPLDILP